MPNPEIKNNLVPTFVILAGFWVSLFVFLNFDFSSNLNGLFVMGWPIYWLKTDSLPEFKFLEARSFSLCLIPWLATLFFAYAFFILWAKYKNFRTDIVKKKSFFSNLFCVFPIGLPVLILIPWIVFLALIINRSPIIGINDFHMGWPFRLYSLSIGEKSGDQSFSTPIPWNHWDYCRLGFNFGFWAIYIILFLFGFEILRRMKGKGNTLKSLLLFWFVFIFSFGIQLFAFGLNSGDKMSSGEIIFAGFPILFAFPITISSIDAIFFNFEFCLFNSFFCAIWAYNLLGLFWRKKRPW